MSLSFLLTFLWGFGEKFGLITFFPFWLSNFYSLTGKWQLLISTSSVFILKVLLVLFGAIYNLNVAGNYQCLLKFLGGHHPLFDTVKVKSFNNGT